MKGVTVTLPDGKLVGLPFPKGANEHVLMAAVRDLMRGHEPSCPLVASEKQWLLDLHDEIAKHLPGYCGRMPLESGQITHA